ncbi:N-acyl-D-amino-acid deacylase family protein [Sphingobium bisphenolivorans]|uniref:N-acyl-D-amino-acid deacylase family protein n=1 Tax=Sphingobium bisphenolivorans TaxID=1335760 RepID=UPI0030836874
MDARGLTVTPGFVDIHTHYDGQVTWESRMAPSSNHGVTTIVTGNCGVGFAPCHPTDHEALVELMAGVEDIPEVVMTEGLKWNWQSFPEYLDAVAARPHDVDIAAMVPHSPLRVFVMGDRAIRREEATAQDISQMADLVKAAIDAGAVGFATSRAVQQKSVTGEPIPTVRAAEDELDGILQAMKQAGQGVFQVLSDFELFQDIEGEFAMFRRLTERSGRPMSYSLAQKHNNPEGWRYLLELTEQASNAGLPIRAQVMGRPTGVLLGFDLTLSPFTGCPSYDALADLPFDQRIATLRDPQVRDRILEESAQARTQDHGPGRDYGYIFEMTDPPTYEPDMRDSLKERAKATGKAAEAIAYDLMLENGGRGILFEPAQNYAYGSLDPSYEMLQHKDTIFGLGDGGAHCGVICDASFPTTMLSYWGRDRTRGPRLPVEQIVKAMTSDNARMIGLLDRGVIAPGYKADLNIIDFDRLQLCVPEVVRDLPSGGRRVVQRAHGYVATIQSGVVTYREGEPTGALPGGVVRGAQPAPAAAGTTTFH